MAADDRDLTERLKFARQIASEAGNLTLRYFREPSVSVERKSDDSPVTIADREAEQLLRDRIAGAYPQDGIVGEEYGAKPGESGFQWILDPIDGTKSFICGVPLYGNLVAVTRGERAVVGVIHFPALREQVFAATGQGAWYVRDDGPKQRARVSACASLAEAVFLTSEVKSFHKHHREAAYLELQQRTRLARTWGDCYGYMLVATGRADLMVDPEMSVWDAAALQPVLEEAGGTFTDWKGEATIHSGEGVATNGHLLAESLAAMRACET